MDSNGNDCNHSLDYNLSYSEDKNYFSMLGWLQTKFPFEFLFKHINIGLLMSALFANLKTLIFFDKSGKFF
jgi:hypothetical protein